MIKGNHIGSSLQRLLSERKKGKDKLAIKSYRELIPPGGGGGTAIYGLYRYVPL